MGRWTCSVLHPCNASRDRLILIAAGQNISSKWNYSQLLCSLYFGPRTYGTRVSIADINYFLHICQSEARIFASCGIFPLLTQKGADFELFKQEVLYIKDKKIIKLLDSKIESNLISIN